MTCSTPCAAAYAYEARLRRLAQRSQRIGGDVARDHPVVMRMTLEQPLEVAPAELRLASGERAAARMHDERIVGQHVAPAGARRTQAEVVLLAVTRAEREVERADRVDRRAAHEHAEPDAGRQIGIRRHRGIRERAARTGFGSRSCGHGLFSQKRGNEQISALFENGVTVAIAASEAAQRASAVKPARCHDCVGVEQHDIGWRMHHPAVGRAVKPRLRSLRRISTCRSPRCSISRNTSRTPGSVDASSIRISR